MVSLDLSRVTENATLISVLMTCASAWMESALLDPDGGQRWVVYDEAWRLMSHPALLRRMDAHWRLARHYGIANMLIFHKLSDLDNVGDSGSAMRALASSLLANAETRVVYRQESDQLGTTAAALGLTGTEQSLLPTLGTGQGLWRIKHRSFVVQHQLHPAELELFDTARPRDGAAPAAPPACRATDRRHRDESPEPETSPRARRSSKPCTRQLTESVGALVTGEDWKRALEFAARFRSRSFNNTMLIYVQHHAAYQEGRVPEPMPTYVAGFKQWLSLNRARHEGPVRVRDPRPGHRPVRLLDTRPTPSRGDASAAARSPASGRAVRSQLVGLKPAHVWDVSQTDGEPIPETPRPTLLQARHPRACGTASPTRSPRTASSCGWSPTPPRSAAPTG